jgi:hypothetical protein
MNIEKYFFKRRVALLISVIYVGLGTITVFSLFPSDSLGSDWTYIGLILTFPVSVISFVYRFAEKNSTEGALIIQLIMFVLTFLIFSLFTKDKDEKL